MVGTGQGDYGETLTTARTLAPAPAGMAGGTNGKEAKRK